MESKEEKRAILSFFFSFLFGYHCLLYTNGITKDLY